MRKLLVVSLALLAIAGASFSQSFNVDINGAAGAAGAGVPAATFAGAATQPGTWNNAPSGSLPAVPLVDLSGAATPVALTRAGTIFSYSNNWAATTGDFELLMDDIDCPSGGSTYTFSGLVPGLYQVYSYAWEPCGTLTSITTVAVSGAIEGPQNVGGALAGPDTFTLGITHALHNAVVDASGSLVVTVTFAPGAPFINVNGFQLRRCVGNSDFRFILRQPGGVGGGLDIIDVCGTPGTPYLNAFTVTAGAFPTGAFFGIDLTLAELINLLSFPPPIYGALDGNGNQFFLGLPVPPGLTLYCVGLTLDPMTAAIIAGPAFSYTTI